ncbi:MAG: InlB B-repeat-containing protein [Myxococcales bacterium]
MACSPESGKSTTPQSSSSNATQITGNPRVAPGLSSGPLVTREPNGTITYHSARLDAAKAPPPRAVFGELLVKFKSHVTRASSMNILSQVPLRSARAYRSVPGLHHLKLAPGVQAHQAMATYLKHPDVAYVEPNYVVSINTIPTDPRFPEQWGLQNTGQTGFAVDADIDAPEAWDITTGRSDVVVAVIDTGVDYNHEDLAANIFQNTADCNNNGIDDDGNGHIDDCHGIDTSNDDSDPLDDNGHGTHVAGIIGAVGNNGIGVAGVAWNVKILPCKFLDAAGSGTTADAIACLDYVAAMKDRGLNIIASNNSWGGIFFSQALLDAIDAQRLREILFVTAAGNDGVDNDVASSYPCNYDLPNVLCVAAFTAADVMPFFSSFGRHTVHTAAPGFDVLSTLPGNAYGLESGTSMASPHVAGTAVLLKAQDPARDWRAIKNLIIAGGDVVPAMSSTISQRRLNANGSLHCVDTPILSRLQPRVDSVNPVRVGSAVALRMLHINCAVPNGAPTVTVSPGGETIVLHDDGSGNDQSANDGVYSGAWAPAAAGTYALTFANGEVITIIVDAHLKAGFPQQTLFLGGTVHGGPSLHTLVGNIDGASALEILHTGIAAGPLYAWKPDGTAAPGWPRTVATPDGPAPELLGAAYPVLGNFTGTGSGLQVFANYLGQYKAAYSGNGSVLPGWPIGSFSKTPPTAADVDGDGVDEIFIEENDGVSVATMAAYRADGRRLAGWPITTPTAGGVLATPAVADLDGDGSLEIITVSRGADANVYAFHDDGRLVSGFPVPIEPHGGGDHFPVVGDVDGDGKPEIIVVGRAFEDPSSVDLIYIIGSDGAIKRTIRGTFEIFGASAPVLADLDGDGIPEIIVQSFTGLSVWKGDGTVFPGWPVPIPGTWSNNSAPVVGDLDGDGLPDIAITTNDAGSVAGHLRAYSRNGFPLAGFPKPLDFAGNAPAIADIDLDGHNELILTGISGTGFAGLQDSVWVYDLGGPTTPHGPIEWGQFMGGPKHQGYYETGKNLPNHAYLTTRVRGLGSITSASPGIDCGTDCIEKYSKGTVVSLTATAATGENFIGWLGACAGQPNPCVVTVNRYTSVAAQFSARYELSVTLTAVGGRVGGRVTSTPGGIDCGTDCSEVYNVNTAVTLTANPTPDAVFSSWSGACNGTASTCNLIMDGPHSAGAIYLGQPLLTVTLSGTGSGTVTSLSPGIDCGNDCSERYSPNTAVSLTAVPSPGSVFAGWSGACSNLGGNNCTVFMDAGKSVTAKFVTTRLLTVTTAGTGIGTVSSSPAGITCGADCSEPYNLDTVVTLTATPGANSVFSGWSGACSGASPTCDVTMDVAKSVTASFTTTVVPTRLLTVTTAGTGVGSVTSSPAGIACGGDCSEPYDLDTVVTLTATPSADSFFSGWTGACSGLSTTCDVTMDAAKSVMATFMLKPVLTVAISGTGAGAVTSNPAGINCGGDCSEAYDPNTVVALTAVPSAGSVFSGWSGACGGSGGCSVAMDAARSVTANFTLQLVLSVAISGTGTGAVTSSPAGINCGADCSELYDFNLVVSLTAIPSQGNVFDGWSGACAGQGNPCVVTMNSRTTVSATFAPAGSPSSGGGGGAGGGSGGCTIGTNATSDPSLPALFILATIVMWRRRTGSGGGGERNARRHLRVGVAKCASPTRACATSRSRSV